MKNYLGDIKSFTKEQFKLLKDLVRNLDIEDIKNLTGEQLVSQIFYVDKYEFIYKCMIVDRLFSLDLLSYLIVGAWV